MNTKIATPSVNKNDNSKNITNKIIKPFASAQTAAKPIITVTNTRRIDAISVAPKAWNGWFVHSKFVKRKWTPANVIAVIAKIYTIYEYSDVYISV